MNIYEMLRAKYELWRLHFTFLFGRMNIYEMLRAKWSKAGIAVNEGVSQGVLDRFEEKHHISLPDSFRKYLLTVNGMKDGQTDENLISFLSLEAIDQENNIKKISVNWVEITFAEFCIYSHIYVLRFSRNGDACAVFATDGTHERQIANSFEDFLREYLCSPARVTYCLP